MEQTAWKTISMHSISVFNVLYKCTHTHTHMCINTCGYICTYKQNHIWTHAHVTHTHAHTCTQQHTDTLPQAQIHACTEETSRPIISHYRLTDHCTFLWHPSFVFSNIELMPMSTSLRSIFLRTRSLWLISLKLRMRSLLGQDLREDEKSLQVKISVRFRSPLHLELC